MCDNDNRTLTWFATDARKHCPLLILVPPVVEITDATKMATQR